MLCLGKADEPYMAEMIAGFEKAGENNYQLLDEFQLSRRYPVVDTKGSLTAIFDNDAGRVLADQSLNALLVRILLICVNANLLSLVTTFILLSPS